jgi:hypothetical protein
MAAPVELFLYWQAEAKNQELFPLLEEVPEKERPLLSRIRGKLLEKGLDIKSWEVRKHRPALLSWSSVQTLQDFWLWCLPPRVPKEGPKWVFWSLGPEVQTFDFSKVPNERLVLLLHEPPTVEEAGYKPDFQAHFGKILTWDDDLVDGKKFFKYHYPDLKPLLPDLVSFEEKRFCVLFGTRRASKHPKELYREREKVIRFFETKPVGEFDLFGNNWEKRKYTSWRGRASDKLDLLKRYKFSICYENMKEVKGYITEKIFDCFAAGNVPVYLGASNITDYIPKECFIDRRAFGSEQELYDFLKAMTPETYAQYLDSAKRYLESEKAQLFSSEHFIETFLRACF